MWPTIQNSSRYTEILLYLPRFRSNCRHLSRFDFEGKRRTPPFPSPFPISFYPPAGGNRRYMYVFHLASYRRPSNIPAISWHRELLPRFLTFLYAKCVYAGSSCTHVPYDFTGRRSVKPTTCKVDRRARYDISLLFFFLLLSLLLSFFGAAPRSSYCHIAILMSQRLLLMSIHT